MLRVTFTFDSSALLRPRYIQLKTVNRPAKYQINLDPIYKPLHSFIANYKPQGYIFNMMELLHSTGLKMLSRPGMSPIRMLRRTFLVTGGLYLALDLKHPDLAIRESFGDFTSGFSHQFGVGLTALSISQAFDVSWDKMQAIDVNGKKVLDFFATIPGGELLVEAKGVTNWSSRYRARSSIYNKKYERQSLVKNIPGTSGTQKAMVGVIIHALNSEKTSLASRTTRGKREPAQAEMEIIDPDFGADLTFSESSQKAGRYWHYAGAAIFAGLYDVAEELIRRADAMVKEVHYRPTLKIRDFDRREDLQTQNGRNVVGIQWQLSDRAESNNDVWFYQALDKSVIRDLIENDVFPNAEPYHHYDRRRLSIDGYAENTFPDGSYFGIGSMQRGGLRVLKLDDIGKRELQY